MKFSSSGLGRKNGFYFKVDHKFYLDGEKAAHNAAIETANLAKFSAFLQDFKSIGVDPMLLPVILQKVYGMDPELRVLASNPEKIRQCLQTGQKESLFDQISHAASRQVFPSLTTPAPSRTSPEH